MQMLRPKQVFEIVGLSKATVYRMEQAGTFPKRVRIGARACGWPDTVIAKWIKSRPATM